MRWQLVATSLVAMTTLVGCPTGYEFKLVPGSARVNARPVISALAEQAKQSCGPGLEPYVHCEVEPALCRSDPITRVQVADAVCSGLRPLLTFVHTSDAQLKEDQVALDGPLGVEVYDHINGASRRNPELERYDFAVFLATMLGVNALAANKEGTYLKERYAPCPAPLPPSFVLHTGDAVDAGMFSELFEFLAIVRQLDVPFFNAVGNHDNLFFGTFPKGVMKGVDVTLPFVPLGDTDRFLRAHHADATLDDFSIPYSPEVDHAPTREGTTDPPLPGTPPRPYFGSDYFGFDLYCPVNGLSGRERAKWHLARKQLASPSFPSIGGNLCTDARGYYGQDFLLPVVPGKRQRKVRLLVLNTPEIGPKTMTEALQRRSRGQMRDEQYLWLERELTSEDGTNTLFIVAGHHDLEHFWGDQAGRLRDILVGNPRVIAYLSGHTHRDAFHRYERKVGPPLWDVTAGSTLVYPEFAHLVDLLEGPGDETYLRIRSFRQRVSDVFCSSDCDLKYLAARGRAGAYQDVHDTDFRLEKDTKAFSNGLFRVAGFPPEPSNPKGPLP